MQTQQRKREIGADCGPPNLLPHQQYRGSVQPRNRDPFPEKVQRQTANMVQTEEKVPSGALFSDGRGPGLHKPSVAQDSGQLGVPLHVQGGFALLLLLHGLFT